MITLASAAIIGSIVSAASALAAAGANAYSTYKANQANQTFADKQFIEQKYLNRSANQLQVADLQKAGINPAQANMSSLSSGSYSSNQQPVDYGSIASVGSQIMSSIIGAAASKYSSDKQYDIETMRQNAETDRLEKTLKNQKDIAELQVGAQRDFYFDVDAIKKRVAEGAISTLQASNAAYENAFLLVTGQKIDNMPKGNLFEFMTSQGISSYNAQQIKSIYIANCRMLGIPVNDAIIEALDLIINKKPELPRKTKSGRTFTGTSGSW